MAHPEDVLLEKLKDVIDPELFVNIVDLGLIYGLDQEDVEDEQIDIKMDMTLTSAMCPAGPQLVEQSRQALKQLENVRDVEVKVVLDPPWTPDRMTEEAKDKLGIF